ncbi:TonB-dependent receptor [Gayadomonas joobiniege]|uniref:TonB-dependent receptor n=1 Tax=Gayadomonas joobiniege TaxID=1234606 RepID=UPI000380FF1B|nr:TonB-dependent siderophore receptor [Gayadomonas joobiniege]
MHKTHKNIFNKNQLAVTVAFCIPFMASAEVAELAVTEAKAVNEEESYKIERSANIKLTQPVANTPRTVNVLSSQILEDQGVTSLNDALRNVAGVSTFGGGEGGGGVVSASDKVSIRGFDAASNIYIDGMRDIAGYSRDLFNYEQVEVIKGSSSSLDGRSTGGGSLNLSTKRARLDDFASVSGQADSFGTLRATADVNHQLTESTAARINLLATDGGDTFDNGEENYQTLGLGFSALHQVNQQTDITLDVFLMEQDNTPVMGLPFLTEAAANATGESEGPINSSYWDQYFSVKGRDFEEVSTQMVTFTINHQINDTVSLRSQTRYGSNDKQSVLGRPWWGSEVYDDNDVLIRDESGLLNATRLQALDQKTDLFVTQLDALFSFENNNISHDLVVGVEYANEEKTSFGVDANYSYFDSNGNELDNPTLDPFNLNNQISVRGGLSRNGADTIGDATTFGIYAFDTIKIGQQWQIDVNARYDDYEITGDSYGRRTGLVTGLKADDGYFSYGAAVSYLINDNGNIYLSYSDAQQPPGTSLALSTTAEENAIEPENATTIELGTKWELMDQRLLLTAAIFSTTKDVTDSYDIEVSEGTTQTIYGTSGEQKASGFELGAIGQLTDSLSISANYVNLDTEISQSSDPDDIGDGLQAAPEDTASLWLSYTGLQDKLNVGGGLNYNSGETYWRQNYAYFTVDSYTTAFLMASYQVNEQLKVQVNIDNLTDEEYVTDYSAKGHFRPGDPQNFSIFAKYDF